MYIFVGLVTCIRLTKVDFGVAVLAVTHKEFESLNFGEFVKGIIYDVKGALPKDQVDARF